MEFTFDSIWPDTGPACASTPEIWSQANQRDVLVVRYLHEGLDSAKSYPKVQRTAKECLSHLESRAKTIRESQTLLRPSNLSTDPAEILVRPACNLIAAEPEKLVRPDTRSIGVPVWRRCKRRSESDGKPTKRAAQSMVAIE